MLTRILKSTLTMTFVALTAMPAAAQLQFRVDIPLPGLEVRVGRRAPPPMQREYRTDRPSRQHTWVPGSWDWQQNDWAWVPGRWDRPTQRNVRWVKPRYVREGPAWRYEPGHWSNQRVFRGDEYRNWKTEYRNNRRNGQYRNGYSGQH